MYLYGSGRAHIFNYVKHEVNGVASQLLTFILLLCQMLRPDPVRFSAWSMQKDSPNSRIEILKALSNYSILTRHWDIYIAFIAKGHQVLKCNGCLSFIVPNPILREKY